MPGRAAAADGLDPAHAGAVARRIYGGYFLLQAVAGIGFWVLVLSVPAVRRAFEMSHRQHAVTDSYLIADIVLGIVGAAIAGAGAWLAKSWTPPLALFVAGGMVYATLYLVGWVGSTGHGGGLLALMVVPSTLATWCGAQLWRLHRLPTP